MAHVSRKNKINYTNEDLKQHYINQLVWYWVERNHSRIIKKAHDIVGQLLNEEEPITVKESTIFSTKTTNTSGNNLNEQC